MTPSSLVHPPRRTCSLTSARGLVAAATLVLTACGGGGGGSSSGSPDPGVDSGAGSTPPACSGAGCPGSTADSGSFRLIGRHTVGTTDALLLVDPARPTEPARLTGFDAAADIDGNTSGFRTPRTPIDPGAIHTFTRDAATGRRTFVGTAMRFFIQGGALYRVSLKPGAAAAAAAVRVSSAASLCELETAIPLDDSGDDAWLLVSDAGADGRCSAQFDNRHLLIRSHASDTAPPAHAVPFSGFNPTHNIGPVSLVNEGVLRDRDGRALWLRGIDMSGASLVTRLYDARTLAPGPALSTAMLALHGSHPAKPQRALASFADGVFRVDWSSSGLAVRSWAYPRLQGAAGVTALATADATWLVDGNDVVRVPDADVPGSVAMRLPFDARHPNLADRLVGTHLAQTPTQVIVAPYNAFAQHLAIYAVDKATGTTVKLADAAGETGYLQLHGVDGEHVLYGVDLSGKANPRPFFTYMRLLRVRSDGSGATTVEPRAFVQGHVEARSPYTDQDNPRVIAERSSVLYCVSTQPEPDCAGSDLFEYRIDSGARLRLGSPSAFLPNFFLAYVNGVDGVPSIGQFVGGDAAGVHNRIGYFLPGRAGSLREVPMPR